MTLRLSPEEANALRDQAEREHRSMQEIARQAISDYVADRPTRLHAAIRRVNDEDAALLERLSR